jgi:hypothetical protein
MKIRYAPKGVEDFHRQGTINLIVSGDVVERYYEGGVYLISPRQAQRIWKHYCGMKECRCPGGGVVEIAPNEYGVRVKYCERGKE